MNKATRNITQFLTCAAAATLIGCGGDAGTETNPEIIDPTVPVSDWVMVWNDEFDGDAIDTTKWNHEVNCAGGGNDEKQCYTDASDNSFVKDGSLHIVALPAEEGAEKPYTSARMTTKYKGDFKYGRFEVRAKLPQGQGTWPAFWMLPTDEVYGGWPKSGEIDILEAVNLQVADADGNPENRVYGTLHYGRDWPDNVSSGKEFSMADGVNPADDFHTYAIEWQEGEIRWYVDGYLFQTQRKSTVRYNSKGEAVGLAHQGWFSEYFDQGSGELTTHWDNAPFDQDFHMILNLAVGGSWPENTHNLGIDPEAFANGQTFEVDYVRVFQCQSNPDTGKGCETVRGGYDQKDDALVEGKAPIPSPPSKGVPANLTIFDGTPNPSWPAWDCCGGSTPELVNDDVEGQVYEFTIGESPTVMGFISREEFITDPAGKPSPFDASPIIDNGKLTFKMKVESMPSDASAPWLIKVESAGASTAYEFPITDNLEGATPEAGVWQTYSFPVQALADGGLDVSAIDVVMIFPAWGAGEGAVYRVTDLKIEDPAAGAYPRLDVFIDGENPSWPMWDCCGGSLPEVVTDEDPAHGAVAEFTIGANPTVMGFISREEFITDPAGKPSPFDATGILANGVIQFDMKVVNMPSDASADWLFKVESVGASTAVEVNLNTSVEALAPSAGEWQTYTFKLSDLADAGLDVSAIDVLMIFPAWGAGEGAVYRVDNASIYDPNATGGFNGHVIFADDALAGWSIWDCCGGSTPTLENDDAAHGMTAEFVIGADPTVMGFLADRENGVSIDASDLLANGVVQFEMKVVNLPNDASAPWLFKVESDNAASAVELGLTDSQEGKAPESGVWQTYTFTLQDLYDKGLDISAIDVLMMFPAWGAGEGAVYRIDNVMIYDPTTVPQPKGLVMFGDESHADWSIWDCCGGSTPTVETEDGRGNVAEFVIGSAPTVMGFLANDDVYFDASDILETGVVRFEMKVVTAPNDANSVWKFKIEGGDATSAAELDLSASLEGAEPVVGEWQTYTFSLLDLFDAGLDISVIDVVMVFPAWGTGEGAVYRIDNAVITVP